MRQCLNKLIDEEIIDKVLEFRIKVKTNTGKEKWILFSDIKGYISSALSCKRDDGAPCIAFNMECCGYTRQIIDAL